MRCYVTLNLLNFVSFIMNHVLCKSIVLLLLLLLGGFMGFFLLSLTPYTGLCSVDKPFPSEVNHQSLCVYFICRQKEKKG